MDEFTLLTRRERHGLVAGGVLAGLAACVATLAPFHEAGRTPWLDGRGVFAGAALHCAEAAGSGARHRCVRQVAATAAAADAASRAVALAPR